MMAGLRLPDLEEKPPLAPEAPVIIAMANGQMAISWPALISPAPVKVYSVKVRVKDGPWQRVDAGTTPAMLVRKGGKGIRAPTTEVLVAGLPAGEYEAVVYAKNNVGWSAQSPVSDAVQLGGEPGAAVEARAVEARP